MVADDATTREGAKRSTHSTVDRLRKLLKKKDNEIEKLKARFNNEKRLREYEKSRADALEEELSVVRAAHDAIEEQLSECEGRWGD
jgi:chromosome segregation ATPase